MAVEPVLRLQGLGHRYGATRVLSGVDLAVPAGECLAVIGPNGAGKSTLFQLASGGLRPTEGRVWLHGRDVTGLPPARIARAGLARGFQIGQLFPRLSALDHLRVAAAWREGHGYRFWRLWSRQAASTGAAEAWLERLGLGARATVPACELSYAEQRALDVGMALASGAQVLLLDEPTAGMSRSETDAFVGLLRQACAGRTLLVVEHDMSVVFGLADRIAVLVRGELLACDSPEAIRRHEGVRAAYLGRQEGQA